MAKKSSNNRIFGILVILLSIYAGFFFAQPINLATADLGRHIANGELLLNGVSDVFYFNHYSFTERNHAFVNHHWGSGLLFYLLHSVSGFKGLSILYILLNLLALLFMGMASSIRNHRDVVALAIISIIPLLAYRVEVRPEGFSYALLAFYYLLFSSFRSKKIGLKMLLIPLLVLQVVWVNLHIFFFFGMVVCGAFLLEALFIEKDTRKTRELAIILGGLIVVSLINPHFHNGLLAPLTIFNEYGYMVAENQTILFMHERFGNPELYHFEVFAVLAVILIGLAFYLKVWKQNLVEILLMLSFLILSVVAVRGIPLFALFFIPMAATIANHFINSLNQKPKQTVHKYLPLAGILFCMIFIPMKGSYASARKGFEALGLIENINKCGQFLRSQQIPGNMFNNYDFGSYLIYNLHDREKVFVDNRPEAYSVSFFDSIYKAMQENDSIWEVKSLEYGINSICFYRLDNTPWAQPFLIRRTQDLNWVAIYVDEVSLVLIRNKPSNQKWIKKFGLSREMFRGIPNN